MIAMLTIATGRYISYIPELIASAQKYLTIEHEFIVFTDGELKDIRTVYRPKLPWPYSTLTRFEAFNDIEHELDGEYDFVYFIDADMKFIDDVGEEILGDLVGVRHPGFYRGGGTFEKNPISTAYVNNPKGHYYQGCFFGGQTCDFFDMSCELEDCINKDNGNGHIAIYHDESHLCRYFQDHPPKALPPAYAFPEFWRASDWGLPEEKKIIHLHKNHGAMRA